MAHDIQPNHVYAVVTLKLAVAAICSETVADGLNEVLREHIGEGFIADYAFYGTDHLELVTASSEPEEGELFVEQEKDIPTIGASQSAKHGFEEIIHKRSCAPGGKRFYSNNVQFLEGIAEGIGFSADSALKVGEIIKVEPIDGCGYLLEVEEYDMDEWSESFSVFESCV